MPNRIRGIAALARPAAIWPQRNVPAFEGVAEHGGTLTLYFEVEDIDEKARRLAARATMVWDLHATFYGMRECYVKDPEGYVLGFAQPLRGG